jgi:hypothetical protein
MIFYSACGTANSRCCYPLFDEHNNELPASWCDKETDDALDSIPVKPDYDPDNEGVSNLRRAITAANTLRHYRNEQGYNEDAETVVMDFMSDLRHFCDAAGLDWAYLWESSYEIGYGAETEGC